jgi:SAM-dependent methyltransferase
VPVSAQDSDPQEVVDRYFDLAARYWEEVYSEPALEGLVYRERMETTLRWVDALALAPGAAVLEVGCGAGLLGLQLARRGLTVTCTDSSPEMVGRAQRLLNAENPCGRMQVRRADVQQLPFKPGEFDLVVALGVLPWLDRAGEAVQQMAHVLAPGGWIIVTADNRARLNLLLEPRENPLLAPLRLARRAVRRRSGAPNGSAPSFRHLPSEVDRMLTAANISPVRRATVGFGPFTFIGRPLLGEPAAIALHQRLHRMSRDRRALRRLGWHYIVAGRKAGP